MQRLLKDDSIIDFLVRLRSELDPELWTVADRWEADPFAIGVASTRDPAVFMYVNTLGQPPGRYRFECHLPDPHADPPRRVAGQADGAELDTLVAVLAEHLARAG